MDKTVNGLRFDAWLDLVDCEIADITGGNTSRHFTAPYAEIFLSGLNPGAGARKALACWE